MSKKTENPQKLIALEKRDSDKSKDLYRTQWKNAQFFLKFLDENNAHVDKFLPLSWAQKETGIRFGEMGF